MLGTNKLQLTETNVSKSGDSRYHIHLCLSVEQISSAAYCLCLGLH
jgi:hypothetical protein